MSEATPPPGWFPDPTDPSRQRYFDGTTWTDNYAPMQVPPSGVGQPTKRDTSSFKRIGVGVGIVILGLIGIGSMSSGRDKTEKADVSASFTRSNSVITTRTTAVVPSVPLVAPAGSAVRDGKFEFQVLGVERSDSKDGMFRPEQAKGEFFKVKLRVTNIGDEARTYFADNQKLLINGNKYEASSSLGDASFSEEINPGLGIETDAVFDIPPGAVPDVIVCHDSAFSGGAHLAL